MFRWILSEGNSASFLFLQGLIKPVRLYLTDLSTVYPIVAYTWELILVGRPISELHTILHIKSFKIFNKRINYKTFDRLYLYVGYVPCR